MKTSSNKEVTVNVLVKDQVKSVYPLFDERTEYLFWGSLIHSIPHNGIELVHELSGIPTKILGEYLEKFYSDIKNTSK